MSKAAERNQVALADMMSRLESKVSELEAKLVHVQGAYGTLQLRFDEFQRQRVLELQKLLKGGPTT